MTVAAARSDLAVCRAVTVVYGHGATAVTALDRIDLAIAAGERVGLVGRSGSGKTTLLHVLGGLVMPTQGEVLLGGELLLCDEPTGQLDSDTGARVLDLLEALHAKLGFALVVATHDPDVAARSDRILTIEDGAIASDAELDR